MNTEVSKTVVSHFDIVKRTLHYVSKEPPLCIEEGEKMAFNVKFLTRFCPSVVLDEP